jgi:hypothetical protein
VNESVIMEPSVDLVSALLETPFSRWKYEDKKDLLVNCATPQPILSFQKLTGLPLPGKQHKRNFRASWYSDYKWLCGSKYSNCLYCWPCLLVGTKKGIWNSTGFSDMANATRSFQRHEASLEHMKYSVSFKDLKSNFNRITDALQENARLFVANFNKNVQLNRNFMHLPINAVLFLAKQELAFRGHNEKDSSENRGNFKELLTLLINSSSAEVKNHYEKIKTVFAANSKTIQNELIQCIYSHLREFIYNEICDCDFFSLIVDDTTDITTNSQCAIIIRYVCKNGSVVERFIGFFDVSSDKTAQALFEVIENALLDFKYPTKLIAQCYDGASVMSGQLNGLQAKVKHEAPQAFFVHCLAHRLNLIIKQSTNSIVECRIFFANLGGIPSFFHMSSKRTFVADSIIAKRIPTAVDTRWSSHNKVLTVVVEEWDGLKKIFEQLIEDSASDEKTIRQAEGYLSKMNNFNFTFLALVFKDIFGLCDVLFNILQKKSLDVNFCILQIKQTQQLISEKRNDESFQYYFKCASERTKLEMKRNLSEEQVCKNFKMIYFEILDVIITDINVRFKDIEKLSFVTLCDSSKFENFSKSFPENAFENLKVTYGPFFDYSRLKNELIYTYTDARYRNIGVEAIIQLLNESGMTDIFKEVYRLLCLIVTIPSTSCSAERSFSALKRIKTYLRNSTSQERLNSLALMSIEKKLLNDLIVSTPFHEDIIDKFAALKDRRIDLVFKK